MSRWVFHFKNAPIRIGTPPEDDDAHQRQQRPARTAKRARVAEPRAKTLAIHGNPSVYPQNDG
jgi:hypothetical protein